MHVIEGVVDARHEAREARGVVRRELRECVVGAGGVRLLAARRLGHHVATHRQRDPRLQFRDLVVVAARLLENARQRGGIVEPAARAPGEHDAHHLRTGHQRLHAREHPRAQLLLPRRVGGDGGVAFLEQAYHHLVDEFVAVAEVAVERHRAHPRLLGDARHGERLVGLRAHEDDGGVDELSARHARWAAAPARQSVDLGRITHPLVTPRFP